MGILDNAKEVAKAVQEIHNLELYQRVLALHSDIIELVDQNNQLRNENAELKKQQDISSRIFPVQHPRLCYYLKGDDHSKEDGPFCNTCWDIDRKLVRMRAYRTATGQDITCDYCGRHKGK
jgi:hypothetical protein